MRGHFNLWPSNENLTNSKWASNLILARPITFIIPQAQVKNISGMPNADWQAADQMRTQSQTQLIPRQSNCKWKWQRQPKHVKFGLPIYGQLGQEEIRMQRQWQLESWPACIEPRRRCCLKSISLLSLKSAGTKSNFHCGSCCCLCSRPGQYNNEAVGPRSHRLRPGLGLSIIICVLHSFSHIPRLAAPPRRLFLGKSLA